MEHIFKQFALDYFGNGLCTLVVKGYENIRILEGRYAALTETAMPPGFPRH